MKMVVIFYNQPYYLTFKKGLMDVLIYQNGEIKHFSASMPLKKCEFQKEPLRVTISNNRLFKKKYGYSLEINEKDLELRLDLDNIFNHWKPSTMQLYGNNDYFFNWKVYAPALNVKGTMIMFGEEVDLLGRGYLDSNEGNFLFNRFLKSWVWGRLQGPSKILIFGSLNFIDKSIFQPVLLIDHKLSQYYNLSFPIILNEQKLQFGDSDFSEVFYIDDFKRIDTVKLLISKIPQSWKFARQVHEIIFYGLERCKLGRHLNKFMANFDYERYSANFIDAKNNKYQGVLESINFK